jgi:hypothetical protein
MMVEVAKTIIYYLSKILIIKFISNSKSQRRERGREKESSRNILVNEKKVSEKLKEKKYKEKCGI